MLYLFLYILPVIAFLVVYYLGLRKRYIHVWLWNYYKRKSVKAPHRHIMFCFVDHYEPYQSGATPEQAVDRVNRWLTDYPKFASQYVDADGRHPQHTFFYPEEEYKEELLDKVASICKKGFGEVEIHLHHDNDTDDGFINKVETFKNILHKRHNLLHTLNGKIVFGFIHGNWALDNSCRNGKWCGLNNEISLLKKLGCYADFTMPSGPNECQTSTVNSIYYAIDDPDLPKSHDKGILVEKGKIPEGDLMIIQGPISLLWSNRKLGLWPRIEYGDITPINAIPLEKRIDSWVNQNIHVKGCNEWVFIKVHTHGGLEKNADNLFKYKQFDKLHQHLLSNYNDKIKHTLHYVTAREMYNIIKAAEAGHNGNPDNYRDYLIK